MDWKRYEKEIYKYFKETYPRTTIKFDQKVIGKFSKVERQIDILIEGDIAGFPLKIVVDCKYFSKKIDVKEVESFCSMVEDIDAHQGVLITKNGFSSAAINRAYYGNQKIELDIINFSEIQQYQVFEALPYSEKYSVLLSAPFGWVIDAKEKINGIASLFQRGLTLEQAQKRKEWMYLDFWDLNDDKDYCIDDLIEIQNKNIKEADSKTRFEYRNGLGRDDHSETKIRIAYVATYPCIEVTGFVKFEGFIFFAVLFTPIELLERNLRKLQYLLSVCIPGQLEFDNTQVIHQLLSKIDKTQLNESNSEKFHQVGIWYSEMNKHDKALYYFRKSLDNFPTHYSFLKHIINYELKYGSKDEALQHSFDLFAIEPKNPTVPKDLIGIFLENGKGRVLNTFFSEKTIEIKDNEVKGNLSFHNGVLLLNMSEEGKAQKYFKKAENFFKESLPANHHVFKTLKEALK